MLGWLALFSVLLGGLFLYLVFMSGVEGVTSLPVAIAVALALIALYAVATGSLRDGGALRRLFAPVVVLLGLAGSALYYLPKLDSASVLEQITRSQTSEEPDTGTPSPQSLRSVRIRRNEAGQFLARGDVNGVQTTFLIDTGATTIVLRQSDAERAGIDRSTLAFTVPLRTASGETNAAAVRLRTLTIGAIRMDGVEALVAPPGNLNENLLGMNFLRRLRSYEISGDFLTLRE